MSGEQQRVSLPSQQPMSRAAEFQQPVGELLRSSQAEALPAAGSNYDSVQADGLHSSDGSGTSELLEPVVPQEEPAGKEPNPWR